MADLTVEIHQPAHEEVAADFIQLPPAYNSRMEQIRRTMVELRGPRDPTGQYRPINTENFETYLDQMLRHAFEPFEHLDFVNCHVDLHHIPDRYETRYKVRLDVVARVTGKTITVTEDLDKFPSKELLGKILVFV